MVGALFLRPGRPRKGPGTAAAGPGISGGQEPGKPRISRLTRQAAHGEIIADGPRKSKGAGRANGALKRAEINTCPGKRPF